MNEEDRKLLEKALALQKEDEASVFKDEESDDSDEIEIPQVRRGEEGEVLREDDDEVYSRAVTGSSAQMEARKEETEEETETRKKLTGLVYAIVRKELAKDPASAQAIASTFDDALKQVMSPHGGTDNFVNLRTPGQPAAKLSVDPGRSGANISGKNPDIRRGPEHIAGQEGIGHGVTPQRQDMNAAGQGYAQGQGGGRLPRTEGSTSKPQSRSDIQPSGFGLPRTSGTVRGAGGALISHPEASPGTSGIGPTKSIKISLMKEFIHSGSFGNTIPEQSGNLPSNPDDSLRGIVSQGNAVRKVFKSKQAIAEELSRKGTERDVGFPSLDQPYAEDEEATHFIRKKVNESLTKRMDGSDN